MSNPRHVSVRPIDHVVHAVADLDSAAEDYESMGFMLTPRSDHPFGTSNRLIVLESTYIELVAVTSPELITGGFAAEVKRVAELGGGLAFLVLRSHYAYADREALAMSFSYVKLPWFGWLGGVGCLGSLCGGRRR